jgi:hypothetical protein
MLVTEPSGIIVSEVDAAIAYDTSKFTVSNARLGSMLSPSTFDVTLFDTTSFPGEIFLSAASALSQQGFANGAQGAVFLVDFTAKATAASGPSAINLQTQFDEGGGLVQPTDVLDNNLNPLTLTPAPTDASNDPVDGIVTVNGPTKTATSTSLSAAPNPSTYGQSVTLTAVVTGSGGTPTGTVNFMDGSQTLGPATLVNGTASLSTANMSAGSQSLTAVYGGDSNFTGSASTAFSQTVNKAPTTTVASNASATFASASQPVTLNTTVSSNGVGVSEGTVTFTVFAAGHVQVGSAVTTGTLSGGSASASFALPTGVVPGTYSILAQYADAAGNYSPSDDSGQLGTLTVVAAPTSTTVSTAQVAGAATAQAVTLQAQVASSGGTVSQGVVVFTVLEGTTVIGTPVTSGTVTGGLATASYTLPAGTAVGVYTIQAAYGGGTDFLAAPTATGTLDVKGTPVLPEINGNNTITGTPGQFNPFTVALNASSPNPLTYSVTLTGDSSLYDLEQQYGFQGVAYYSNMGTMAYLLKANANNAFGNPFYLIRPSDGALFAYRGGTYADTFTNVTPTAVLGANVYTDPNLLVKAQAPVNYSALAALEQQYGFVGLQYYTNAGNSAYLLQATSNNRNGNLLYLLRSTDGALFAYAGGTYAATYADPNNLVTTPGVGIYNDPGLLTNAVEPLSVYTSLYQLNQRLDLQELGGTFYTGSGGHGAEWFYSPVLNQFGEPWYTLTLQTVNGSQQAVLTAFEGYADSEVGAVVATLDPSVYSHPTWLTGATAAPNPTSGTASVDASGNLKIGLPSAGFLGTFKVTVTASDGSLSASQTAMVTVTDAAPTLSVKQGTTPIATGSTQSFPQGDFPQSYTATATGTQGATLSVSASVSNSNPLFTLEQQYRFRGLQYYSNGGNTAYLLQSAGNNRNGNPTYLVTPSGDLYAYAGGSYAATYADSSNHIASLGTLVYADPTLLTGALPALNYTTLFNTQQQFHFQGLQYFTSGTDSAYLLQASSNNAHGNNIYLLAPNGGLYAYAGGTYAATYGDPTNLVATLDPQVYLQPTLLTGAVATPAVYAQLQAVESAYDLTGSQYFTNSGIKAFVLQAPQNNINGNTVYLLLQTGALYAYGGGSYSDTTSDPNNFVAMLAPSAYTMPALLTSARAPVAATGITATPSGGGSSLAYSLNVPASFVGSLQVTVTATDGALTTTDTYQVTSTDVPTLNSIPAQTASLSGSPLHLTLSSSQPASATPTYSARVAGYSLAYNLQQQYHFQGLGYFTTSDNVKVYTLQASTNNANGNPLYLLSSTGGLYAYDGGSEFGTTLSNSANLIAQLGAAVYTTPTMLTNAQPPQAPTAQVNVAGNQLTVNVTGASVGTVFEVFVTVNDGVSSSRSGFLVTVTA